MTAVELERARYAAARAMFRLLATGEEQARAELFAGCTFRAEWQQALLRRIAVIGVAERIGEGRYCRWRLVQTDEAATLLQTLSTDDDALTSVLASLWHRGGEEAETGTGGAWAGSGAPVDVTKGEGEKGGSEMNGALGASDDVRLDFALRLLAAMLENTVYIREAVDELKGRVAALEEAFK